MTIAAVAENDAGGRLVWFSGQSAVSVMRLSLPQNAQPGCSAIGTTSVALPGRLEDACLPESHKRTDGPPRHTSTSTFPTTIIIRRERPKPVLDWRRRGQAGTRLAHDRSLPSRKVTADFVKSCRKPTTRLVWHV